jgi:hypothetical protein
MAKRDMKSRLGASLKAETQAVKNRFDRADAILGKEEGRSRLKPVPEPSPEIAPPVIRDSFTMPAFDYDLISSIKQRCLQSGVSVTKSEVLRAGLNALMAMPERELKAVVAGLRKVKTGRPPGRQD